MKKTTTIVIGAALVLVLGGAAVAVAQVGPPRELRERHRDGPRLDRPGRPMAGFHVLHSDGVGVRRDGTQVEFRTQTGVIRAVSATEITLESPGNYVQTYRIDGETHIGERRREVSVEDLEAGDAASVYAVKSGNEYLAKKIRSRGEPSERLSELLEGRPENA